MEKTLREIQASSIWGAHTYSAAFQADPRPHRDASHALLHIHKAAGKLDAVIDHLDHGEPQDDGAVVRAVADILICALRFANTWPGGRIDAQEAILARLREKGIGPAPDPRPVVKSSTDIAGALALLRTGRPVTRLGRTTLPLFHVAMVRVGPPEARLAFLFSMCRDDELEAYRPTQDDLLACDWVDATAVSEQTLATQRQQAEAHWNAYVREREAR
jgi:hypothetical protein